MVSTPMMRKLLAIFPRGSHWRPQAMCDIIFKRLQLCRSPIGVYRMYEMLREKKKKRGKSGLRQRTPGSGPFQSIQVDFT